MHGERVCVALPMGAQATTFPACHASFPWTFVHHRVHEKEARLQEKIQELSRERKQVKGMANQVANLVGVLGGAVARCACPAISCPHLVHPGACSRRN